MEEMPKKRMTVTGNPMLTLLTPKNFKDKVAKRSKNCFLKLHLQLNLLFVIYILGYPFSS